MRKFWMGFSLGVASVLLVIALRWYIAFVLAMNDFNARLEAMGKNMSILATGRLPVAK